MTLAHSWNYSEAFSATQAFAAAAWSAKERTKWKLYRSIWLISRFPSSVNEMLRTQLKINFHYRNELELVLMTTKVSVINNFDPDTCEPLPNVTAKNIKFLNRIMLNLSIQCMFVNISFTIYAIMNNPREMETLSPCHICIFN